MDLLGSLRFHSDPLTPNWHKLTWTQLDPLRFTGPSSCLLAGWREMEAGGIVVLPGWLAGVLETMAGAMILLAGWLETMAASFRWLASWLAGTSGCTTAG